MRSAKKTRKKSSDKSRLEIELAFKLKDCIKEPYVRQYRFNPDRRWTSDFAWPDLMLLVEVEGGTWVNGSHSRGARYKSDCEKYNSAALLGYTVLRFTTDHIKTDYPVDTIKSYIDARLKK